MTQVRVRFAPSPTGPLHIGGARSALFNYLYAKGRDGKFIVRIEDTDLERSNRESEKNILDSLRWLGINWDEGIEVGGDASPYRQTERLDMYRSHAQELIDKGMAYHCYCTQEELEADREAAMAEGRMPVYSGKCRNLSEEQKSALAAEGRKPVVRFKVPENKTLIIEDQVRGTVSFESNGVGDYVIIKSDGIATYNFAAVIDDHYMNITHVIRGEEHLSNTPRQIVVYDAFGWDKPEFAHISLILGKDKKKMSKRDGATSVVQYQEAGYLPEALVNFLALLGWSPSAEEEIFSMDELIQQFSLDRVAKNPAVFDFEKLKWLNGIYIRKLPMEKVAEGIRPFLGEYLAEKSPEEQEIWLNYVAESLFDHINTFADIKTELEKFMKEDIHISEEAKEVLAQEESIAVIRCFRNKLEALEEVNPPAVKEAIKETGKEMNAKGKGLFMPVRIGISGELHGPDLANTVTILGKEKTLGRIDKILQG